MPTTLSPPRRGALRRALAWFAPAHARYLWSQFADAHGDRHVKHPVITIWMFCAAMVGRLAEALGWIHTPPGTRGAWSGAGALVHTVNDFWISNSPALPLLVLMAVGGTLTLLGQLEDWDRVRLAGLWLAAGGWFLSFGVVLQNLGVASSLLFLVPPLLCSRTIANLNDEAREYRQRLRDREAQAMESVKLAGAIIELTEVMPAAREALCQPLRIVGE